MSTRKRQDGKRRFGLFAKCVHFVLIVSSLIVGTFLTGGYFLGEDMPFVGWLFEFPMLFFLGAAILMVFVFAGTGLRCWVLLPLAEVALCVLLLQPQWNSFEPVPKGTESVTIMSYNVNQFLFGREGIVDTVCKVRPDILILQEYSGNAETLKDIQDKLFPDGNSILTHQNAVFSKYHIKEVEWVEVSGYRSIQKLTLDVDDEEVTLCNVHFPVVVRLNSLRMDDLDTIVEAVDKQRTGRYKLLELVDNRTGPMIVSGDFNAAPHTILVRTLQEKLQDSFLVGGAGIGNSFDSRLPLVRIDYVFLSDEFTVYSHEVLNDKASDHRPIVVRVSLDQSE